MSLKNLRCGKVPINVVYKIYFHIEIGSPRLVNWSIYRIMEDTEEAK